MFNDSLSSAAPRARTAFARATASSSLITIARSAMFALFVRRRARVFAASARMLGSRLVRNFMTTRSASSGRARNAAVRARRTTSRSCLLPLLSSASSVSRIASLSSFAFASFGFAAAIFPAASTARARTGAGVFGSLSAFSIASAAFTDSISPRANAAISRTLTDPLSSIDASRGIAFPSPMRPAANIARI